MGWHRHDETLDVGPKPSHGACQRCCRDGDDSASWLSWREKNVRRGDIDPIESGSTESHFLQCGIDNDPNASGRFTQREAMQGAALAERPRRGSVQSIG
jgi:hypothetical protein